MRYIDATYSHLLFDYLASRNIVAETVLGPLPEAGTRIAEHRWRAMLTTAADTVNEPAFGLAVANLFSLRHLGPVGYLLANSHNTLEALAKGQRYHVLISEMNPVKASIEEDSLVLSWPLEHGYCGQLWDELGLGTTLKLVQTIAQHPIAPLRVDFVAPPPSDIALYEAFFGCPVCFQQPMPKLVFPAKNLLAPIPRSDPHLHQILDRQAQQQLDALTGEGEDIDRYRSQLLRLIPHHQPTLATLAAENGTSTRSLQRRLRARGMSFQQLLDQTRCTLAERYLKESRLNLPDIAGILGYTEQSSFSRAFIRWRGIAPGQYRRRHRHQDTH